MQYSLSSSDEGSLILQGRCAAAAAGAKFKIFSAILQGNGYIEFTSFILIQLLNNLSIMLYQNLSAEVFTSFKLSSRFLQTHEDSISLFPNLHQLQYWDNGIVRSHKRPNLSG